MTELTQEQRALVDENRGFAFYLINKCYPNNIGDEDLRQEALVGLCEAAKRFDESLGYPFITYAQYWIKNQAQQYFRRNALVIVAAKAHQNGTRTRSFSITADSERGIPEFDIEADDRTQEQTNAAVDSEKLLMFTRTDRERRVLEMRHGIDDDLDEPKTLQQIATVLGLCSERVRQLEQKGLARVRKRASHLAHYFLHEGTSLL